MTYKPDPKRYDATNLYRRCGKSGLMLPQISLGLWHNFGAKDDPERARGMLLRAFDLGITHFDLANNYGPPGGAAELTLGRIMYEDLAAYRDELIISTKAGYDMWPGPYGNFGSRKYLLASLDQSLERLGLDYVDIFYSHRPDPETPIEETCGALAQAVRQGKALYVGISNYNPEQTEVALRVLRELGTPCLIHQPRYSMFDRTPEKSGLFEVLRREGTGSIVFSPLAQGLLSSRYLTGLPKDARAVRDGRFLKPEHITKEKLDLLHALDGFAKERGQTLAQLALSWVLREEPVTSALIGASSVAQIEENVAAAQGPTWKADELGRIEQLLAGSAG
ncbi:MAG TPA: aldo/keto reductase [Polyangiaceae bacterium]|nr:aldo/keto reductase [Polyangiaceae bacterium]